MNKQILIDKTELINKIATECHYDTEHPLEAYAKLFTLINDAPTIDAEPVRHGKWMHNGFMEVKCNNCGNVFHELEDTNYCPHCGYKMDLDEVEE